MEVVFGRDATSVFPNMNKDDDPMEALKASIGAKRFVSETEVRCGVARQHTSSHEEGDRQAVKLHLTQPLALTLHCALLLLLPAVGGDQEGAWAVCGRRHCCC